MDWKLPISAVQDRNLLRMAQSSAAVQLFTVLCPRSKEHTGMNLHLLDKITLQIKIGHETTWWLVSCFQVLFFTSLAMHELACHFGLDRCCYLWPVLQSSAAAPSINITPSQTEKLLRWWFISIIFFALLCLLFKPDLSYTLWHDLLHRRKQPVINTEIPYFIPTSEIFKWESSLQ